VKLRDLALAFCGRLDPATELAKLLDYLEMIL
jgi:hypothetical protein